MLVGRACRKLEDNIYLILLCYKNFFNQNQIKEKQIYYNVVGVNFFSYSLIVVNLFWEKQNKMLSRIYFAWGIFRNPTWFFWITI